MLIHLINLDRIKFRELTMPDVPPLINIGTGSDQSIIDLVELIKEIVGFNEDLKLNSLKPDRALRKVLNVEKINKLRWSLKINLKEGITQAYKDYNN